MVSPRIDRKIPAIMAVDVAGYSALVEQDEAERWPGSRPCARSSSQPLLSTHHGRLIKLLGDGFLAEFASVVDAVACAAEIQDGNRAGLPLRIGVNLGDVVIDGDDLSATGSTSRPGWRGWPSRAESWSRGRPSTICTASRVLPSRASASSGSRTSPGRCAPIGWSMRPRQRDAPHPGGIRPSIAVLPFDNLGGDPEQTYFSDGTCRRPDHRPVALSRSVRPGPPFLVRAARRGAGCGRDSGVAWACATCWRAACAATGERVRITAQLIDATSGDHLWAERYDRALDDIFAVQDEVVATIAATLAVRIHVAGLERAKRQPTEDLAAYECVLRGRERLAAYGPEANAAARELFARAVALDPEYALAHAFLALAIFNEEWGEHAARQRAACLEHANLAARLDPTDSRCHRILAMILLEAREFERAGYHADRAVALNPHDGDAAAYRAYILCFLGRPEEALAESRRALALTPFHPNWYWGVLARALHGTGRYEEAIMVFERAAASLEHQARLAACHTPSARRLGAALRCSEP